MIVRVAFVVLGLSGGFGAVLYGALWVGMPDDNGRSVAAKMGTGSARDRSQRVLAIVLLSLGTLLLLRETGLWIGDKFIWPLVLAAGGLALVWPESTGLALRRGLGVHENRRALLRIGVGIVAVTVGIVVFGIANTEWHEIGDVGLAVGLTITGLLLIFGPWWLRLGRDLVEERRRRIRSEERAEVAARIHDSVLQTLALIQQKAGDATETARLARRQERELRDWLFGVAPATDGVTLKAAMSRAAAEVEDLFGVVVDVVTVGDAGLDERLEALVSAAKEAMVNAAKFSGAPTVSVYVEVTGGGVTAYVRDRGAGFIPETVPPDRQGIAESIRGRMQRHGGSANVRSTLGEGAEVELMMPGARAAPQSGEQAPSNA